MTRNHRFKTLLPCLTIALFLGPSVTAHPVDEVTEISEDHLEEMVRQMDHLFCPDGCIDPTVKLHVDFEIHSCAGNRHRVVDHKFSAGAGATVIGKVPIIVFGATYSQKSEGWTWRVDCLVDISEFYAEGKGSFARVVEIRSTTRNQDAATEASCQYTLPGSCKTENLAEGSMVVSFSSDGVTGGYPTYASASLKGYALSRGMENYRLTCIHSITECIETPSLPSRGPITHGPEFHRSATIVWDDESLEFAPHLADFIGDLVPGPLGS